MLLITLMMLMAFALERRVPTKNYVCDKVAQWNNPALTRTKTWDCGQCTNNCCTWSCGQWGIPCSGCSASRCGQSCIPCSKTEFKNQAYYLRVKGPSSVADVAIELVEDAVKKCAATAAASSAFAGIITGLATGGAGAAEAAVSAFTGAFQLCMTSGYSWSQTILSQFDIGMVQESWWDGEDHGMC